MTLIYKAVLIVVAVLLILSVGGNVYQHFSNDSLSKKLATATLNLTNSESNNKLLKDTIDSQNKQIANAAEVSKGFQSTLDSLADYLKNNDKKNTDLINLLKNTPAPKTCEDSKKYLKDNLELYQW